MNIRGDLWIFVFLLQQVIGLAGVDNADIAVTQSF